MAFSNTSLSFSSSFFHLFWLLLFLHLSFPTSVFSQSCTTYISGGYPQNCTVCDQTLTSYLVVGAKTSFCAYSYYNTTYSVTQCVLPNSNNAYYDPISYQENLNVSQFYVNNTQKTICFNCSIYPFPNCTYCNNQTLYKSSLELKTIWKYTTGCSECNESSTMNYTYDPRLEIYVRGCQYINRTLTNQSCFADQFWDNTTNTCRKCKEKFSNCAACNRTFCYVCNENFYYSRNITDYQGRVNQSICLRETCQLGQGPLLYIGHTNCQNCTISNCISCYFKQVSTNTETCTYCKAGYYLSANTCVVKSTTTKNLTYYVKPAQAYTSNQASSSISGDGSWSSPFIFLWQAIVQVEKTLLTNNYINSTAYIYLLRGDHYYFQCDSEVYQPTSSDKTDELYDYCTNMIASTNSISQYYFKRDNYTIYIKALTCELAMVLGLDAGSLCVRIDMDSKPTLYIQSSKYYFNISNFYMFENIHFTGVNQFGSHSFNSAVLLRYFPIKLCQAGKTPTESVGRMQFVNTNYKFDVKCSDSNYTGSMVPRNSSYNTKCLNKNISPKSMQSCQGEPYQQSYFQQYMPDNPLDSTEYIYEYRQQTLFNLYSFIDLYSNVSTPPTLIIKNCDFDFFMVNYNSLVNVETYQLYKQTTMSTYDNAANTWVYYIQTGADKGAIINITSSTFQYMRFCKGAFYYRRAPFIQDQEFIQNQSHYFQTNKTAYIQNPMLIIDQSTFQYMNYQQNTTTFQLYTQNFTHPSAPIYGGDTYQPSVLLDTAMHKGIIINFENFPGKIELSQSTVNYNYIFVPEILITNYSNYQSYSLDNFYNEDTNEYEFASCDPTSKLDQYLLGKGFSKWQDTDQLSNRFERMSPFYISKNRDTVIINTCTFSHNMGFFGGVFFINSMNFDAGNQAYFIISNCKFIKNQAYFSGGAVFVRNTMRQTNMSAICSGVAFLKTTFMQNLAMKKSNGGAVSIICVYMDNFNYWDDYWQTSAMEKMPVVYDYFTHEPWYYKDNKQAAYYNYTQVYDSVDYSYDRYNITREAVYFRDCNLNQNYVGLKGSAIYIANISEVVMEGTLIQNNGAVLSITEQIYSPYFWLFYKRALTYFDETILGNCFDEFQYAQNCNDGLQYIDYPQVQGAVYIEFCQSSICMNITTVQMLYITNCWFQGNDGGPFLNLGQDIQSVDSLYIVGGINNTIAYTKFSGHYGNYLFNIQYETHSLDNYMPPKYFNSSQSPIIKIVQRPVQSTQSIKMSTTIKFCSFFYNDHVQIIGVPSQYIYNGSLLQYFSNADVNPNIMFYLNLLSNNIFNNYFIGNSTALMFVQNAVLNFTNNTFQNNGFLSEEKFVQTKTYSNISYQEFSPYVFSYSQQYGMIWVVQNANFGTNYSTFSRNNFIYCFASEGSALKFDIFNNQYTYFEHNTYQYLFSTEYGSYISINSFKGRSTFWMKNETIKFSYSGQYGAIYSNSPINGLVNFFMQQSNFINCYATMGSAFAGFYIGKLTSVEGTYMNKNYANQTNMAVASFVNKGNPITSFIATSLLYKLTSISETQDLGYIYLNGALNQREIYFGVTLVQLITDKYITYSQFHSCNFTQISGHYGSAVYSFNSSIQFTMDPSRFNYANFKDIKSTIGAIYLTGASNLELQNITLSNNIASDSASVIYSYYSSITIVNSTFLQNKVLSAQGTLYLESYSSLFIYYSKFINNSAIDAAVLYAQNNGNGWFMIQNTLFSGNKAYTNLMNVRSTFLNFTYTNFTDNVAQSLNNGVTMQYSKVYLYNCLINYTNKNFLKNYTAEVGFFYQISQSSLYLSGTLMNNTRGSSVGGIQALTQGNFTMENGSVIQNCLSPVGPCIYLILMYTITLSNSIFINNTVQDIQILNSAMSVYNTIFKSGYSNYIYAYQSELILINVTMQNARVQPLPTNLAGGGVYCQCDNLTIINSTFSNLYSYQGGAIYLVQPQNQSVATLENNTFFNNTAQYGGAIYIQSTGVANLTRNNFTNNKAIVYTKSNFDKLFIRQAIAGAIFYACKDVVVPCQLNLINGNQFIKNSAIHQGGAIMWYLYRYNEIGTPSNFSGNQATYGTNYGSWPQTLISKFISNNDQAAAQYNIQNETRLLQASSTPIGTPPSNSQLGPNGTIKNSSNIANSSLGNKTTNSSININKTNSTNSTISNTLINSINSTNTSNTNSYNSTNSTNTTNSTNSTNQLFNLTIGNSTSNATILQNWTIVSGTGFDFRITMRDQDNQRFNIDNSTVASMISINNQQEVVLYNNETLAQQGVFLFQGIQVVTKPGSYVNLMVQVNSLVTFGGNVSFLIDPIQLKFYVRYCVTGETMTINNICLLCPTGTFAFTPPLSPNDICKPCDPNAYCYNGAIVAPKPGYWRSTNISEKFILCPNFEACLGGDRLNPMGRCAPGYGGILCGVCNDDYFLTSDFHCGKCPSKGVQIFKFIIFCLLTFTYVHFTVQTTINAAELPQPIIQVFLKIVTHHLQILGIIDILNFSWPDEIKSLMFGQSSLGLASVQIVNFECLVESTSLKNMNIFNLRLILYIISPIVLIFLASAFWIIFTKLRNSKRKPLELIVLSMTVFLFILYPNICILAFQSLNCTWVNSDLRLNSNIDTICYTGNQLIIIMVLTIPGILFWIIGIPLYQYRQMAKYKKSITTIADSKDTENSFIIQELKVKYGFLFNGFKGQYFYWEVYQQYKMVSLVIAIVFLSHVSLESQVWVAILILFSSVILQIIVNPYKNDRLNNMQLFSNIVCLNTVYIGMYFVTGQYYSYTSGDGFSMFLFFCIMIPQIGFFIYWLYQFRIQLLILFFGKNMRLFKIFACGLISPQKFKEKYMNDDQHSTVFSSKKMQVDQKAPQKSQYGKAQDFVASANLKEKQIEEDKIDHQFDESEQNDADLVLKDLYERDNKKEMYEIEEVVNPQQITLQVSELQSYSISASEEEKGSLRQDSQSDREDMKKQPLSKRVGQKNILGNKEKVVGSNRRLMSPKRDIENKNKLKKITNLSFSKKESNPQEEKKKKGGFNQTFNRKGNKSAARNQQYEDEEVSSNDIDIEKDKKIVQKEDKKTQKQQQQQIKQKQLQKASKLF